MHTCSLKVFSCVPSTSQTRMVLSYPPLRKRWQSGIAATAHTWPSCVHLLTRLLLATFHTLTTHSDEPLITCLPSGVTATTHKASSSSKTPGFMWKVWTIVPSTLYSRTSL